MGFKLSSQFIKLTAERLGFSACGASPAGEVEGKYARSIKDNIVSGRIAGMKYLANNLEMRLDPRKLVEGTKSIISVALNYYPSEKMDPREYTIAYYAYGKDYHIVMKQRLYELFRLLKDEAAFGGAELSGRAFCDSAPACEKYWAWKAGIGFIGKNTLLIIPGKGSYFFLGELFINLEVDSYDSPVDDGCGDCDKCLRACPCGAISTPYVLDARKCLSYLTIENRGDLPNEAAAKMRNCIYGCDRCQRACPYNENASPTDVPEFKPAPQLLAMKRSDWEHLSEEEYCSLFRGSAVRRAKYSGLMRNIKSVENQRK